MSRERIEAAGRPLALFADGRQAVWGLVLGGEPATVAVAVGTGPALAGSTSARLVAGDTWEVDADGLGSIVLAPVDSDVATTGVPGEVELCRVNGRINVDGGELQLDGTGARVAALPAGGVDSVRAVGAWFPDGAALGLVSARPVGARGHDRDRIAVVLTGEPAIRSEPEPESPPQDEADRVAPEASSEDADTAVAAEATATRGPISVFDPRLSTTYDGNGAARRVGVEMWLGDSEDGDQYPRRIAGERIARLASLSAGPMTIEAYTLLCHGREDDGLGIYLLARSSA